MLDNYDVGMTNELGVGRSGQEWAGRRRRDDLMARYRLLDEELPHWDERK